MMFYFLLFHKYNIWLFGTAPDLFSWNMELFIAGVIIHMMYIVPAGETAELTFQGKSTKKIWSDGIVFVPNILHFTITWFHSTLTVLWGLKLTNKEYVRDTSRLQGEVFANQMMPRYNRNTQMSKMAADLDRAINFFGFWLFGWKRGEDHLVLMRFGFRLIVIAYIWATVVGTATLASNKANDVANQTAAAANSAFNSAVETTAQFLGAPPQVSATQTSSNLAQVLVNFCEGKRPTVPLPDLFMPSTDEGKVFYRMIDGDIRKYFQYAEAPPGKIFTGWVKEPSCYTVAPGREILFMSPYPPQCVVNMEPWVNFKYSEKGIFSSEIREATVSWKMLNNRWSDITKDSGDSRGRVNFKTKALEASRLPSGSYGGIVCF